MAVVILAIIASWMLPLPLAMQVLMTVFGSLHCIVALVKGILEAKERFE